MTKTKTKTCPYCEGIVFDVCRSCTTADVFQGKTDDVTGSASTYVRDSLGVEIHVGDRVIVNAYGGRVRLHHVRTIVTVRGVTARGNLTHDAVAPGDLPTLDPMFVAVMRRDGTRGLEGNGR